VRSKKAAQVVNAVNPRDKFCYYQMKKGKLLKTIMNEVNKNSRWDSLYSPQGVSAAARRFARKHGLPWPPVQR
jgi:hypothetical protein